MSQYVFSVLCERGALDYPFVMAVTRDIPMDAPPLG
jgi:hypothetical protein